MVRVAAKGSAGGGLAAGKYHCIVSRVESHESDDRPHVIVTFMVLAGTDEDAVEREHREYFYLAENQVGRFIRLFVACDLISMDDWKQAEKDGEDLDLEEGSLEGRQCLIDVQMEEQKKKEGDKYVATGQFYPRIGFRMASVSDPKWKDVPKNAEYLAMLGIEPDSGSAGNAAANSPRNPNTPASGKSSPAQAEKPAVKKFARF